MSMSRTLALSVATVCLSLTAGVGGAAAWPHAARASAPSAPAINPAQLDEVQRALDERRLMDAGQLIDELAFAGGGDPRLRLLTGELALLRGRYADAIQAFQAARQAPALLPRALEGEAIALAELGRREQALPLLQQAVAQDPAAWRAWNALGAEYDVSRAWGDAEQAYGHAIAAAPNPAIPLNNRGYSRLLQGRLPEAVADFVAALDKQPDLVAARSNLRLAMALRGEYDRAVDGASGADRAASLNNAGLAAGMRGDFVKAEALLQKAMDAKGEFYQRASENLSLVQQLASRTRGLADAP